MAGVQSRRSTTDPGRTTFSEDIGSGSTTRDPVSTSPKVSGWSHRVTTEVTGSRCSGGEPQKWVDRTSVRTPVVPLTEESSVSFAGQDPYHRWLRWDGGVPSGRG